HKPSLPVSYGRGRRFPIPNAKLFSICLLQFAFANFRSSQHGCLAQDLAGEMNLPRQSYQAQQADHQISYVNLPPAQTVSGGARKGMVVVMPAFSEREQRYPPEVRGTVWRVVAPITPHMRGAVDQISRVIKQRRPHKYSPNQPRQPHPRPDFT